MVVLFPVMLVVFWPQLVQAVDWLRWVHARRAIHLEARTAAADLDLEYELLLHTHR